MNLFKILGTIAVKNQEANDAIDETADKAEKASTTIGEKFTAAGNKISGIGKALAPVSATITAAGTALVGLASKTASTTDNIDKMSQKLGISRTAYQEWDYILSQNGASIDSLKMGMKTLNGVIDSTTQAGSTAGTAFERLGISYDDLKGKSQEEIFEMTIKALQNCTDETERTALANDLLGRSGTEMAPLLNSGAEATEALRQKAHDLGLVLNDDTIDAGVKMTDAMDTMKRSLSSAGASIATAVMPYVTKFCDYISSHMPEIQSTVKAVVEKFDALSPTIKKVIAVIAALLAVASPVLVLVGKFISGIGGIITKVSSAIKIISTLSGSIGGLSGVLAFVTNPITLVIAGIVALIAIFMHLWKTNEDFRKFWLNLWSTIKEKCSNAIDGIKSAFEALKNAGQTVINKFNDIKQGITEKINNARDAVKNAIDKIKSFFNFSWSLPKIKLPHFSISGSFSLKPPSVPHFSVEWYKKAMDEPYMFTKPTIFDVNPVTGQARGAGDAGDELMIGKETMLSMIRQAVAAENAAMLERFDLLISLLGEFFPRVLEKMNRPVVLESGALVGELAPEIDAALGEILRSKERG